MPQHPHFPLLTMIDAARSPEAHSFADDPEAGALERRARQLADAYWPDRVFLTGNITRPLLDAVTGPLEDERQALHGRIRVLIETQRTSTPRA